MQVSSSDVKPAAKQPSKDTAANGGEAGDVKVEVEDPVDAGAKFD